jgi:hypothetical protein
MNLNQLFESKESTATLPEMLEIFLPFAIEKIGLDHVPRIKLVRDVGDDTQPTFGRFSTSDHTIELALQHRHPLDILRTLAHEMVHYRQDVEHQLNDKSGDTGSPEENEANELAGIIMREFNKANPQFFKARPVMLPE